MESAGTKPGTVRPEAIAAMRELGIDISGHRSKHVDEFEGRAIRLRDYRLRQRQRKLPGVFGAAKRLHHSFDDPPPASEGTDEERMAIFRRVRMNCGPI